MSITDELRSSVANYPFRDNRDFALFERIADRIDAEHERQLEVMYHDMSDDKYVKLPVDADGEPIHIGDELEDIDNPSSHGEVHRIELTPDACWVFVNGFGRTSNHYRHYHVPTVEDVLHEMIDEWVMADSTEDEEAVVVECAKKLRLQEEA